MVSAVRQLLNRGDRLALTHINDVVGAKALAHFQTTGPRSH